MTVTIVARAAGGTKDSMVTTAEDVTWRDIGPGLMIAGMGVLTSPEKAAMMTGAAEAVTAMTDTAEAVTTMEGPMAAATVGEDINKMIP